MQDLCKSGVCPAAGLSCKMWCSGEAPEERTSSRSLLVNMSMTVETSASDSGSASCSAYGLKEYSSRGLRGGRHASDY